MVNRHPSPTGYDLATDISTPDRALLAGFEIRALYRSDQGQVTIWASLTDDTTRTIAALLADPRTDSDTGTATPAPGPRPPAPGPRPGCTIRHPLP